MLKRILTPEWIDLLPANDPRIVRSRSDMLRLNRLNRSPALMAKLLQSATGNYPPQTLTDLGSGDGLFCLDVGRQLHLVWPKVTVRLLDQQLWVRPETLSKFNEIGWTAIPVRANLLTHSAWADGAGRHAFMANLFLHHFSTECLAEIFSILAATAHAFVAIEPRRGWAQLFLSHWLGLLGCGIVSRHDGPASIRAGFQGRELAAQWPASSRWQLTEHHSGLFCHVFVARRSP